jgi:hypothetical protein
LTKVLHLLQAKNIESQQSKNDLLAGRANQRLQIWNPKSRSTSELSSVTTRKEGIKAEQKAVILLDFGLNSLFSCAF